MLSPPVPPIKVRHTLLAYNFANDNITGRYASELASNARS